VSFEHAHLSEFMDGPKLDENGVARAGKPLEPGTPVASRETAIEAVKTVYDPEIPVNIYDLGLIYKLLVEADGSVEVKMTLTAPGCPVAGVLPGQVAEAIAAVPGVGEVEVELTWEPSWTPALMTDEARVALDMF